MKAVDHKAELRHSTGQAYTQAAACMTWYLPLLMCFAFSLPASKPAADQELLLQQLAVIAWSLHGVCGLITAKIASSKGRNPAVSFVKV
jgi:hypothetical protein